MYFLINIQLNEVNRTLTVNFRHPIKLIIRVWIQLLIGCSPLTASNEFLGNDQAHIQIGKWTALLMSNYYITPFTLFIFMAYKKYFLCMYFFHHELCRYVYRYTTVNANGTFSLCKLQIATGVPPQLHTSTRVFDFRSVSAQKKGK